MPDGERTGQPGVLPPVLLLPVGLPTHYSELIADRRGVRGLDKRVRPASEPGSCASCLLSRIVLAFCVRVWQSQCIAITVLKGCHPFKECIHCTFGCYLIVHAARLHTPCGEALSVGQSCGCYAWVPLGAWCRAVSRLLRFMSPQLSGAFVFIGLPCCMHVEKRPAGSNAIVVLGCWFMG